jgi:hypothetical protein
MESQQSPKWPPSDEIERAVRMANPELSADTQTGMVVGHAAEPALSGLGEEAAPPQWVIMGIEVPGGVAVLASSTLTRAQMRRRFENVVKTHPTLGKLHLREEHDAVLFECSGFTFIHGDSYRECMRSLSDVWQPPEIE